MFLLVVYAMFKNYKRNSLEAMAQAVHIMKNIPKVCIIISIFALLILGFLSYLSYIYSGKYDLWNWSKNIIIPIISALIGGGITLVAIYYSIKLESKAEQEKTFQNSISAIKTELKENKSILDAYCEDTKEVKITSGDNRSIFYIQLSNSLWDSFKYEIVKIDKTKFDAICLAYVNINKVNSQAQFALSNSGTGKADTYYEEIKKHAESAKVSIEDALKNLENV